MNTVNQDLVEVCKQCTIRTSPNCTTCVLAESPAEITQNDLQHKALDVLKSAARNYPGNDNENVDDLGSVVQISFYLGGTLYLSDIYPINLRVFNPED